jgi:hypothetical protein
MATSFNFSIFKLFCVRYFHVEFAILMRKTEKFYNCFDLKVLSSEMDPAESRLIP